VASTGLGKGDKCLAWQLSKMMDIRVHGKLDPTFNATVESFDPDQTTSVAKAVALQANGQIVVGGLINDSSPIIGGLVRLNSNGELILPLAQSTRLASAAR
jgi:hypothetical protein